MRKNHQSLDKILLFTIVAIAVLGVVFLYSATYVRGAAPGDISPLVFKQAFWVLIGLIGMLLISSIDYNRVLDYAYFAYVVNIGLLLFLVLFGGERFGAKRWVSIGPFSLQPSEFIKIIAILILSNFLGERKDRAGSLSNFISSLLLIGPAFILILLQPDLGTSLVLVPILFSILFILGENVKYLWTIIVMGILSMPIFWNLLKDYQKSRLMVFINPNEDPLGAGYTIIQSKIAIGSGGFWGKGWLNGTQSHLKFLPERHTDFIFSVIGEEWGFLGGIFILTLYSLVIYRGIRIISGLDDTTGKGIAVGFITLMAFQVMINISMTIGFVPVVGLPLPMISYGGSNTIAFMLGAGFLLSVSRHRKR